MLTTQVIFTKLVKVPVKSSKMILLHLTAVIFQQKKTQHKNALGTARLSKLCAGSAYPQGHIAQVQQMALDGIDWQLSSQWVLFANKLDNNRPGPACLPSISYWEIGNFRNDLLLLLFFFLLVT